jgi:hypothetical protein
MALRHDTAAPSPTHDDGGGPYSCVPSLAGHVRQVPAPVVVHTAHVAVQPGMQQARIVITHTYTRSEVGNKPTSTLSTACCRGKRIEVTMMCKGKGTLPRAGWTHLRPSLPTARV